MSTAKDITFRSSVPANGAILADVKAKVDGFEQSKLEDSTADVNVRSKSSQRKFLAQTATQKASTQDALPVSMADAPKKNTGDLFSYLTALMLFQLNTGKAQSSIAELNQNMTEASMEVLKAVTDKAAADFAKQIDQEESRKHSSLFSMIFSIVAMVLGAGLCATGGGAFLFAMGAASMGMNLIHTSNGDTLNAALDSAVGGLASQIVGNNAPTWLTDVVKDAILLMMITIVTAVGTGGINALADAASSVTASTEAAPEELEMTAMNPGNLARGLENAATDVERYEANIASNEQTSSFFKNTARSAEKRMANATMEGFKGNLIAFGSSSVLSQDVSQQIASGIAKMAHPTDPKAEQNLEAILSGVFQFAIGLTGSIAGAQMNGALNGSNLTKMVGVEASRKIATAMKTLQTAFTLGSAGYQVKTGLTMEEESANLADQADSRLTMAITQGMIDSLQTSFANMQSTFKGVYKDLAAMSDVGDRLAPYNPQNYI